jgi:hypothetical protein
MRGPPAAAGELTDAVKPGEQDFAVERFRGGCPIEAWIQHQRRIEQIGPGCKGIWLRLDVPPLAGGESPEPGLTKMPRSCQVKECEVLHTHREGGVLQTSQEVTHDFD